MRNNTLYTQIAVYIHLFVFALSLFGANKKKKSSRCSHPCEVKIPTSYHTFPPSSFSCWLFFFYLSRLFIINVLADLFLISLNINFMSHCNIYICIHTFVEQIRKTNT